jgi:hypothetical protein
VTDFIKIRRNSMPTHITETSPRMYARIVGALYLLIFFVGPFAFFMGRTSV